MNPNVLNQAGEKAGLRVRDQSDRLGRSRCHLVGATRFASLAPFAFIIMAQTLLFKERMIADGTGLRQSNAAQARQRARSQILNKLVCSASKLCYG